MNFRDILKLIRHEYAYDKAEWMFSIVLQGLIFISVLFLITVAGDMNRICSGYIQPLYPDGYEFTLVGYSEEDIPKLEHMGFYDVTFSNVGNQGSGVIDSLDGIWLHKLQAALAGKDIWNEELDEFLSVIFFGQIVFGAIGAVMLILMLNNLSNSFAMRLMRRKRYIRMLEQLGCAKSTCRSIYYGFFGIRNIAALVWAAVINGLLIHFLNGYMAGRMYIGSSFTPFCWSHVIGIWIISTLLMWLSFQKQWRLADESW